MDFRIIQQDDHQVLLVRKPGDQTLPWKVVIYIWITENDLFKDRIFFGSIEQAQGWIRQFRTSDAHFFVEKARRWLVHQQTNQPDLTHKE